MAVQESRLLRSGSSWCLLCQPGLGEHSHVVREKHKMSFFGVFPGVSCQAYVQACWRTEGLSVPGSFCQDLRSK